MTFVKYLLVVSVIVNLFYLRNYISIFTNIPLQNVIPETENDYPLLTKENLRGMRQEVNANIKVNIIDTLIREHWSSIYNGVILASGQENISSYTASLNCYHHLTTCYDVCDQNDVTKLNTHKGLCHLIGSILPTTNKEIFIKYAKNNDNYYRGLDSGITNLIKKLDNFQVLSNAREQNYWSSPNIMYDNLFRTLYVPNRDLQFEEPTLTNINLAKRRMIQFNLNVTEIEDIVEAEIENKILATFPDINIHKTYSECCQKLILSW